MAEFAPQEGRHLMDFWTRLEEVRTRWNVLEHPFYEAWTRGELTREDLASYAGQYRHAVVALAQATAHAARSADDEACAVLSSHAAEEAGHVALWDDFARAVGTDESAEAAPETAACAAAWAGAQRPLTETLVALHAIESSQPEIARVKHAGLIEHYGLSEGPATEYFSLHAVLDVEHAAQGRRLLEPRLEDSDVDGLLTEAESVLRGNWELLDGVERERLKGAA